MKPVEDMQPVKFFVYGTLQRGEVREKFWPRTPLRVESAFTLAKLHDLGPYPAMVEGDAPVRGELWTLAPEDAEATLAALDAVEGYNQGGPDWYVRRRILCHTFDGARHEAFAYFWADPATIADTPLIPPDAEGYCDWKRHKLESRLPMLCTWPITIKRFLLSFQTGSLRGACLS